MKKIKELPYFNRPREKLIARGQQALSETDLLAILLGSGVKGKNVILVARSILRKLDQDREKLDVKSLMAIEGIGLAKACQIIAAVEFSRRRFFRDSVVVQKAQDVLPFISHVAYKKQENFLCISLNGANEIIDNRVLLLAFSIQARYIHGRCLLMRSPTGQHLLFLPITIPRVC